MAPRPRFTRMLPAAWAACLAAATLATAARATTMAHLDTRSLTLQSSDIVIGKVERVRSYWTPDHARILTDVSVAVSQSFLGAGPGSLTLTQYGGTVGNVRVSVPGCPVFKPGEEALLFVWRDPQGHAQVNGLAQGKFDISRDRATGEMFVQRKTPGFEVSDVKALGRVPPGQAAAPLPLQSLVREIHRALNSAER